MNTKANGQDVYGNGGYRELIQAVKELAGDLYNAKTVFILGSQDDVADFITHVRSTFSDQERADKVLTRLKGIGEQEAGDGSGKIHFSLARRQNALTLIQDVKNSDKTEFPIKAIVMLYPTEEQEKYLPLLVQSCPGLRIYEVHPTAPGESDGIFPWAVTGSLQRVRRQKLSDVQPDELRYLWPQKVPLGNVTIFAGHPGVGKSLMALDLAGRGSTGMEFLDGKPNEVGKFKTLLLAAEDDKATIIVPRLMALGADLSMIEAIDTVEFLDEANEVSETRLLTLESDLAEVERIVREDPLFKLVVIDPLSNYMGNRNMFKDQELRAVLMPVVRFTQETDVAVVVIMHNSKQSGRTALEKVGASIGGVGTARIGWTFAEHGEKRLMLLAKKNLGQFPGIEYTTEEVSVPIHDKDTKQARMKFVGASTADVNAVLASEEDPETRRDQAASLLIKRMVPIDGEVAAKRIYKEAERLGISETTLKRAKLSLRVEHRKVKEGWLWFWPHTSQSEESLF